NKWRKRYAVLNLTRLNRFEAGTEVRPESLLEAGLVKDVGAGIKVLGTGDLTRKLTIHAHRFSAEARRKIEAAGGTVAVIEVPPPIRPKTKRAKNQPKPAPVPAPESGEGQGGGSKPPKAEKKQQKGEKPAKAQAAKAQAPKAAGSGNEQSGGEKGKKS
ncbi:MAG TPA: uL15m family ribosomal protein, partial [Candidatus Acidoferrum sp.]|nr:uL15m family ribosomal protein [Candidatus Acidoferrum sp.]